MKDAKRAADTFDSIAAHFDRTRNRPWREVVDFIEDCEGSMLDLGCGNGRHTRAALDVGLNVVALDVSIELLRIAKSKTEGDVYFVKANVKDLPFKERSFDDVLYIATIHHLKYGRLKSLKEVKKVLKPGGKMMVSSWARELDRWELKEGERDIIVPWNREDGEVVDRFYHLYTLDELNSEVEKAGFLIEKAFRSGGNNYVVARKS